MNKQDLPFLQKISLRKRYAENETELANSIAEELHNILTTRATLEPFVYGVRDAISVNISSDDLEIFRRECELAIQKLEPRLQNVIIKDIKVNNHTQQIELKINCRCHYIKEKLAFNISI